MKELDLMKIFGSMKENDISELVIKEGRKTYEVRRGGFKQNIVSSQTQPVMQNVPLMAHSVSNIPVTASSHNAEKPSSDGKTSTDKKSNLFELKSPLVGTFYAASKPDAPNYVEAGSKVKKGQTLCIVEAMKNFNEIESEVDGVIEEICVKTGDLVEFGKVLFKVKLG